MSNYVSNSWINTPNPSLKIFYQIVRGLKTKIINLRFIFLYFLIMYIIILTETWLLSNINDTEFRLVGYYLIRHSSNPNNSSLYRGREVLVAIIFSFKYFQITFSVKNVEQILYQNIVLF